MGRLTTISVAVCSRWATATPPSSNTPFSQTSIRIGPKSSTPSSTLNPQITQMAQIYQRQSVRSVDSVHYFADNGGEGVVLKTRVAWELAVEIAAENRVARELFEDVLPEQRRACDAAVAGRVHGLSRLLF